MLKICGLQFGYGNKPLLRDVCMELGGGETGVMLGKNGSGKTTLFKNILGINKPKGGAVLFDGEDLLKMSGRKRAARVAYVPQEARFGELSVFDAVLLGRTPLFGLRAGKRDFEAVNSILRKTGLSDISDRIAENLSGGEKRKVAVARALACEPRLLIFDEPTDNLDIANEMLICKEIKRLAKEQGAGVLCSLHDLSEALNLGDRFFFLKDGVIKYSCEKDEVNEEIIADIFDVEMKIVDVEGQKAVIRRNYYD